MDESTTSLVKSFANKFILSTSSVYLDQHVFFHGLQFGVGEGYGLLQHAGIVVGEINIQKDLMCPL